MAAKRLRHVRGVMVKLGRGAEIKKGDNEMAKIKGSDFKGFFADKSIFKTDDHKKHKSHKHSGGGRNWLKSAMK